MPCPIDIMPVYVKAGSIMAFGPAVQYTSEKKWDNLEIRIYPGADGEFTLYETKATITIMKKELSAKSVSIGMTQPAH